MNFIEITFSKVKTEIENFLKQEHAKAEILYSPASPYGQILSVIENLFQLSFLYLKNTINQFDISDPNSNNERIIRNAAIFAGHIPSRNISATGTLKFVIKSSTNLENDIPGGRVKLFNRATIRNKTNGLDYSINIGDVSSTYKISNNSQFYIPIIQGKWQTSRLTGTGEPNQTFQVSIRGSQKEIENFNVEVTVDGVYWPIKPHIYDLLPDEQACIVRTGFNGGIDIIFGNSGFGAIPNLSSNIEVNYLVSDGSSGSIFRRTINDWTFIDQALDGNGDTLDMSKVFDVQIYTDINFGADKEDIKFTKNILPISSNNFVLGTPQQYAYQIKRLGVFSHVNAYENSGIIHIVATPNINLFRNQNADYFSININAFILDRYEISKIDNYLKNGGNIILTRRYDINSPELSYYVMNIFIITYSDAIDENVNSQINEIVSDYFLNLNRINRIPKSDLIKLIQNIKEVHSVEISFMCKKNEDYHAAAKKAEVNRKNAFASQIDINNLSRPDPNYNPNQIIGIDPILGDLIFEPNELPIIRGGWYDRNEVYYSDNIDDNGLKSLNIIKKGSIDVKNRPQI